MQLATRSRFFPERFPSEKELPPMTLVVALFNQDEIVFAADTLVYDYSQHKSLKPTHKIKTVGSHIFASSDSSAGYDICNQLASLGVSLDTDIEVASQQYFDLTNTKYNERRYNADQTSSVLFGGIGKNGAQVFYWKLPSLGGLVSNPSGYALIGAKENAATGFVRLYHSDTMTTDQRIRLAHFAVTKAGESDPRVGDHRTGLPVDVTLVTQSGVKNYTQDELKPFIEGTNRIDRAIRSIFERGPE